MTVFVSRCESIIRIYSFISLVTDELDKFVCFFSHVINVGQKNAISKSKIYLVYGFSVIKLHGFPFHFSGQIVQRSREFLLRNGVATSYST